MKKKSSNESKLELVLVGPCETSLQDQRIMYANKLTANCDAIVNHIQQSGARLVQYVVVLGGVLCNIKANCEHGEWGGLFKQPNSKHVWNLNCSQEKARLYMKAYNELQKKAKKTLGNDNPLQSPGLVLSPSVIDAIGKLTDATTIRGLFEELGVISPPKERGENLPKDGNKDGRPGKENTNVSDSLAQAEEEESDEATEKRRSEAAKDANYIYEYLTEFRAAQRHQYLTKEKRAFLSRFFAEYAETIKPE